MKKFSLLILLSLLLIGAKAQMSGTYNVGPGQTYTNPQAAINALVTNGVNGPVVLNVYDTTYTGALNITSAISGISSANTVTMQSVSRNPLQCIVATNSYLNINANASYFRFEGITFGSTSSYGLNMASGTYTDIYIKKCNFIGAAYGVYIYAANATNVVFDSCVITQTGSNYGLFLDQNCSGLTFNACKIGDASCYYGIYMGNYNISNVTFRNCDILSNPGGTGSEACVYYYPSSTSYVLNNVKFIGNRFDGGVYGLYLYRSSSYATAGTMDKVIIDSNTFTNFYTYGMYFYYNMYCPSISYNTITIRPNAPNQSYGIYAQQYCTFDTIVGNKISIATSSNYAYGMYFYAYINYNATYLASGPCYIANNEIKAYSTSSYAYGMYLYGASQYSRYDVLYNSIYAYSGSSYAHGVYIYPYNSSYKSSFLYNNIHVQGNYTYPLRLGSSSYMSSTYITIDSNNYYCTATNTTYYGYSSYSSLSAWKTACAQEAATTTNLPNYLNPIVSGVMPINLEPADSTGLSCVKNQNIMYDILGLSRGSITTKGAYDAIPRANDMATQYFVSPSADVVSKNVSMPIRVLLENRGTNSVTSMVVSYSLNGVQQDSNWTGSLSSGDTLTFTLGSFIPTQSKYYDIVVWVSSPNGVADAKPNNNRIEKSVYGCDSALYGTISIGGAGATFAGLSEAAHYVNNCGVSGPVTFLINNGIYNESFKLFGSIPGISTTNTITFMSASGNADSVQIYANGITLTLVDAANIQFKNISLGTTATSGNIAVLFENGASNIEFYACNLYANTSATSASAVPVYYSNSTAGKCLQDVKFIKNTISGGFVNMCFYTSSTVGTNFMGSVTIDSNTMTLGYRGGLARGVDYNSSYYMYFPSISYNTIIGRTGGTGWQYGICLGSVSQPPGSYPSYYDVVDVMQNNKIILQTNGNYGCGIWLGYYLNYYSSLGVGGAGTQSLIANNEIIHNTTNCYSYGMYGYYTKANIVHNSIYLKNTNTSYQLYGMYIYNSSTSYGPMTIKNNNIVVSPQDPAKGYPMYYSDAASYASNAYKITDYNNYYSTGGLIGYIGSDVTTMENWRSITGQDQGSVGQYPSYENFPNNLKVYGFNLACPSFTGVTTDIENTNRASTTIMGAYEFISYVSYDIQPYALVTPSAVVTNGIDELVSVRLMNVGTVTVTLASINWSFNGVAQTAVNWSGSLTGGNSVVVVLDTITPISGTNNIVVYTSLPNDTVKFNDTLKVDLYGCDSMFNGMYTIGSGGNFSSIEDALSTINKCGMNGPVTLALLTGNYPPLSLSGSINGMNEINTITITSFAGNADSVLIGNTTTAGNALILDRASHWIFKDVTIGMNSTYTRYALELKGLCENVLFYGCKIQTYVNTTSSSYVGVYCNNSSNSTDYLKNVRFVNNTIDGGYYNFSFTYPAGGSNNMSASAGVGMSVFIDSNTMTNAYYAGIYSYYYAKYNSISYNTIQSRASSSATYYGIYTYYYTTIDSMIGNKILVTSTGSSYGMYLYRYQNYNATYGAAGPMFIANNEVIVLAGSSTAYAFYDASGSQYSRFDILHNSFYVSGTSTKYGVYLYPYSTSYKTTFLNNNVYVSTTGTGYMIYFGSTSYNTTSYCTIDYNNYYKPSGTAYYGNSYTSLAAWVSAKSQDVNSTTIDPGFAATPSNLIPTTASSLLCPVLTAVTYDIMGMPRVTSNNNKGCYAKTFSYDAALTAFISPKERVLGGSSISVSVKLANFGSTILTGVTIGWSINGVSQTPVVLTGLSLPQYKDTVIVVGSFIPTTGALSSLKAYTYLPNGNADLNLLNDTVSINAYGCSSFLNGTYTVGSGKDFSTLNDVYTLLHFCGVSGPVTFLLDSGNYGAISITETFPGTSTTNTVTLTSATGDSTDVVFSSTTTAITLQDAAHLVLHKVTIDVSSGNVGILFAGRSEDIEISNCEIKVRTTSTSTYRGISRNNEANPLSNIRILNNNIDGGYYGIYLYGYSSTSERNTNIVINNNMINTMYYGIYAYYTDLDYVNGNTITQHTLSTNANYGMYLYYCYSKEIVGNKIKFDYSTNYGIYASTFGAESAFSRLLIANNEMILTSISSGRGIYIGSGHNYTDFYHNSILLKGSGQADGCLYLLNSGTDVNIKNNNFINLSGSSMSSATYSFYTSQQTYLNTTTMNYNNYYTIGANLMYAGSAITSLDMWKMIIGKDFNSLNIVPNFTDTAYGYLHTDGFSMFCPTLNEVTDDINKTLRSLSITNMGCYHDFSPIALDAKLEMIVSPTNNMSVGLTTPIEVKITNFGATNLDSVNIYYRINGGAIVKYAWTGVPLSIFNTTSTITIGSFVPQSGLNTVLVYLAEPNGGVDLNTSNDTLSMLAYACDSLLNGTYTVGTGGDFSDESEMMAVLHNCGINGPIVFEFLTGTYGALSFASIPGSSAGNTITLTSATQKATDVVFAVTVGDALLFNNTSHFILKDITLDATANMNGSGVSFLGTNTNILITKCVIKANINTTSNASAGVYYSSSSGSANFLSNVRIINNTIDGGYANVYLNYPAGSGANMSNMSVFVDSNVMTNSYSAGLYSNWYSYLPSISYNNISSRSVGSVSSSWYGIYLYYYNSADSIVGNKIFSDNSSISTPYGLYLYYYMNYNNYGTSGDMIIANNEIRVFATSTPYGLRVYNPNTTKVKLLHNSIYVGGTGSGYGMYIYNSSTSYNIEILNNNIACYAGSSTYPIYLGSYYTSSYVTLNYNNYYSNGSYVGYAGSAVTSLSALQTATGQDVNSVSINPSFINVTTDLQLSSYIGLACPRLSAVPMDLRNNTRSSTTTMGSYEPFTLDAAIYFSDTMPTSGSVNQSSPVYVVLKNEGIDTLVSVTLNWSVNGVLQTPIPWTGSLVTGADTTLNVGTLLLTSGYTNSVKIWTSNPNASTDPNASNDTITIVIYGCDSALHGTYTVGSAGSDFATLNDAMFQLMTCGISGPVEMQFVSGVYDPLAFNQNVPGADSVNTVCFTSIAGVADSVVFRSLSGVSLTLDAVSYLQFKQLTFDAVYGTYGVEFKNSCSHILFYECNIAANPSSTSSSNVAVRYYQSSGVTTYLSDVRFIKNNISGGYYNFQLYYPCGSTTEMSLSSITIDSNTLTDAYYYGIYSYYYSYYPSISYNKITSRATSGSFYGLYLYYYNTVETLQSNKIRITATSTCYGIRTYGWQNYYASSGPMYVANNEFIILGGNSTAYGIYAYSTSNTSWWDFINNSLYVSNSSTCYGLYTYPATTTGYKSTYRNNLIHVNTSSSYNAYPIYFASITYADTAYCTLNYNNYYVQGTTNIYYVNTTYSSLSAWQTSGYNQDLQSVNLLPVYVDSINSLRMNYNSNMLCPRVPGVMYDVDGYARATTTAMGSYEFDMMDVAMQAFVSPVNGSEKCLNDFLPVEVTIANVGNTTINMGTTPLNVHLRINGAVSYQKDTIISSGSLSGLQTINIQFANAIPLIDTGICNITAYISLIDINSTNDTLLSIIRVVSIEDTYDTLTICDNELPYSYGDSLFTAAGNYQIPFKTHIGCDSLVLVKLYVNPTYSHTDTLTICDNELPLTYGDSVFVTSGNYDVYFTTIKGCDSLVYLQLYVNSTYAYTDTVTLCESELPLTYGDSTFVLAGNYDVHFSSKNGCDSLVNLQLYVNPTYVHTDTFTLCDSELPLTYGDSTFVVSGNYDVHFSTINGCDSLINLQLYVNQTYNEEDTITICNSSLPYTYGDSVFTQEGDYVVPFQTIMSCDSIVNLRLNVINGAPSSAVKIYGDTVITTAGNYTYYVNPVANADYYVWTISNTDWTGSSLTETIDIYVSNAGSGTISVKAVNICGESDAVSLNVLSSVNITEVEKFTCVLGQNIPNPASSNTKIPYAIPEDGKAVFKVMSVNGQVLYNEVIHAASGTHYLDLNTESLSAGIYYYSMEYKGQRLVKKMTVQK